MKNAFAIIFGLLMLISVAIWIIGILTATVIPWLGGVRAEEIGQIGLSVALLGEGCTYGFGVLSKWLSKNQKNKNTIWDSGAKKYGTKKSQN